jgi:hypothetical protein
MDLAGVGSDRSSDLAGHDDRALDMGRVDPEIGDERFCEADFCVVDLLLRGGFKLGSGFPS